jgi:hypothetical protein
MTEPDLSRLATVLERMRSEFDGIRTAKVAKWFAAWAPAHVPMVDSYVGSALVGPKRKLSSVTWMELLNSYRTLVVQYLNDLIPQMGHPQMIRQECTQLPNMVGITNAAREPGKTGIAIFFFATFASSR